MSMAINRVSANTVAAMLYPVVKPGRLSKVDGGGRTTATTPTMAATPNAVQGAAGQASANPSSDTAGQVHAAFQYAQAALESGAGIPGPDISMAGTTQGGGAAYAQSQQPTGQVVDFTA